MSNTKRVISTILAMILVFSFSNTQVNAASNTNTTVITGRNELNVATGVITADKVPTLAHYATDVTLTGKVVIDGPKLVLLVNGQDVSNQANLVKVADKTWTYQYKTTVGNQTGDVTFNIGAYTIYINGKTAGQTHTAAASVGQKVHVPFVKAYDYTQLNWTGYDRTDNQFTFNYHLVKIWDDGIREEVTVPVTAGVNGTEVYRSSGFEIKPPVVVRSFAADSESFTDYNRSSNTFDLAFVLTRNLSDGTSQTSPVSVTAVDAANDYIYTAASEGLFPIQQSFRFTPPVVFRDFVFSAYTPIWTYNSLNHTYSVSFTVNKVYSNGTRVSETITRDGLTPGAVNPISVTIDTVTHETGLTAPAAPAPVIPASVRGAVTISRSLWTGNNGNGGNVKEYYSLSYVINGEAFAVPAEFTFNPGTGYVDQNLKYTAIYQGTEVAINYTLQYVEPASKDINTTN